MGSRGFSRYPTICVAYITERSDIAILGLLLKYANTMYAAIHKPNYPVKTKRYKYFLCNVSRTSSMLVQHCRPIKVEIQMFCVYWVAYRAYMAQYSLYISAHSWPNTPFILFIKSTVGPYRL